MDPDIKSYPAVYRAPLLNRLKPLLIVAPLYLLAVFGRAHLNAASPFWTWLMAVLGFVLVVTSALSTSFCTVTLYADRIEKKTWFGRKVMKKSDVGDIRPRGRSLMMLAYKYNYGDGMVMPKGIGGDPTWNEWMKCVETGKDSHDERARIAR